MSDLIERQAALEPYKTLKDTDTISVGLIRANILQQESVTRSRRLTLEELESVISEEISKDFKYDTEADEFFVYRHKYTGEEIHIQKEPKTFVPVITCSEKQNRWIPVSERLPEDGIYLVTVERIAGKPRIETKSFAKDLHRVDGFDFPKHKCGWYDYDSEYGYWEDASVIAWMPLPPSYKGE